MTTELFERAKKVMPGGVNSPVRAFKAVGISPKFIQSAKGNRIKDIEGIEYIDFVNSWGCMILGHCYPKVIDAVNDASRLGLSFGAATEKEVELAECIVDIVPNIEMIRMVNSGTESVMSALRLARAATNKNKIIKFAGCYHGHVDSMLVKAGSGALTYGFPDSLGVTNKTASDTLVAKYNDLESVLEHIKKNKGEIAAIILEPVAANMGVIEPKKDFLKGLRDICDKEDILLIFDEVITGFRLALGGAQEYFSVKADIVTFGKIIGGGLPVGAYGASKELMSKVAPLGAVYQAGTLSGNPLATAAGLTTLNILKQNPEIYTNINNLGKTLANKLRETKHTVNQVGSLICAFMQDDEVFDLETAQKSDTNKYAKLFRFLIKKQIYIAPAQFEALFISNAHTEKDIDLLVEVFKEGIREE